MGAISSRHVTSLPLHHDSVRDRRVAVKVEGFRRLVGRAKWSGNDSIGSTSRWHQISWSSKRSLACRLFNFIFLSFSQRYSVVQVI